MPGFDGTGPRGMGSMSGGRKGYCAVSSPSVKKDIELLKELDQALHRQLEEIEIRVKKYEQQKHE